MSLPAIGLILVVIWALRSAGLLKAPAKRTSRNVKPGIWVFIARCTVSFYAYSWVETESAMVQVLVLVPIAVACTPGLAIECVAIPLGLPRVAFWMTTCLRPLGVGSNAKSTAVCHAARALLGKARLNESDVVWLERELRRATKGRGAMLVAEGLLAVLRGDLRTARVHFRTADALHKFFISRALRAASRDWLVADAAAAGNWEEVIVRGARGRPRMRWSYAVGRMAQRLTRDYAAPSRLVACALWGIAPRRQATWSLLRRAMRTPPFSVPNERPARRERTLAVALGKLARLPAGLVGVSNDRVIDTARALQEALEAPSTLALVERRALALGATRQAQFLLGEFRAQLETTLGAFFGEGATTHLPDAPPELLLAATRRARQRLLRDLEVYCGDYKERTKTMTSLSELEEWRQWAKVRDAGERLLALDPPAEATLFHVVYIALCNFAVFQHNQHQRAGLAHQMFDWLHERARRLDSPRESALMAKNMKAALK